MIPHLPSPPGDPGGDWLSDRLAAAVRDGRPSADRRQIAAALIGAHRLRVGPSLTMAASLLAGPAAGGFRLPHPTLPPVLWAEFDPALRFDPQRSPVPDQRGGLLFLRDPAAPDAVTLLAGWLGSDGAPGFSASLARVSLSRLASLPDLSEPSWTAAAEIGMPAGLRADMDFHAASQGGGRWGGGDLLRVSHWRTACDVPFALALLCLLGTANLRLLDLPDARGGGATGGSEEADLGAERGPMAFLARRRRPGGGVWCPPFGGLPIWVAPPPMGAGDQGAGVKVPDPAA